jgi:hypothetical protein
VGLFRVANTLRPIRDGVENRYHVSSFIVTGKRQQGRPHLVALYKQPDMKSQATICMAA